MIRSGSYQPGQKLPVEADLARKLNVSRTPLREALQMLARDGYILRRQGRGTFVCDNAASTLETGLETLDSMTDVVRKCGLKPGTAETHIELVDPPDETRSVLGLKPGEKTYIITRVRTADACPFSWGSMTFPERLLDRAPLPEEVTMSMMRYLEVHGADVVFASASITPVLADAQSAQKLNVRKGSPLLLLEQVHYARNRCPVAVSKTLYRPDLVRFKILRTRH